MLSFFLRPETLYLVVHGYYVFGKPSEYCFSRALIGYLSLRYPLPGSTGFANQMDARASNLVCVCVILLFSLNPSLTKETFSGFNR